ncbi:Transmembrane channel-like protein 7 [Oopsacas minuta]|uniref:Transmembrane channel-like protein 7 n=1 Tax=Oopsacas minuta TaxID=111878 RepID=A0AAV7JJ21_9METZ|nr:Transmembrane channel-like protein 7 [Oopsacas minuta]
MAEPDNPVSRTPPPVRASSYESRCAKAAKLVRYHTLPEYDDASMKFLVNQAPSQFGWFDQGQSIEDYKKVLLRLSDDKQLEAQLQQDAFLNEIEKNRDETEGPDPVKLTFKKAAQKVINVNAFLSQINQSIQDKINATQYPRRSSFNGVSRYRKCPQVAKMAEVIDCTKRRKWKIIWNKIKIWRRIISAPIHRIEYLIESRFGSSAVSYFVLVKRLILLNLFIGLLSVFIWLPAVLPCPPIILNSTGNDPQVLTCLMPVYSSPIPSFGYDSLLTGRGLDNTSLYLGFYRLNPRWDYKSAYFYTFFISTFSILLYISYFLGQAYIDTYSILNSVRHISSYIANLVFGGWTYTLTNSFSVKSEHNRLRIVLRETVWECSPRHHTQRLFLYSLVDRLFPRCSSRNKHVIYVCCLWTWRVFVWMITLTLLTLGSSLIVITALQRVCTDKIFIYSFIPSLWHSFLELIFSWLTALEFYDTQRKGMVSLIIKHLLMRVISLISIYIVVVYVYFLSRCEGFSSLPFPLCFSGSNSGPVSCLASGCWETEVAKIFHEYLIAQFISSIFIRSVIITLQNLIRIGVFQLIKRCSISSVVPAVIIGWIKGFFNTHFHLPKHVIKVIYIQSLVWSGMLFCPYQHIIGFFGFVLLYFSMFIFTFWNCRISPKHPRTARSNLIYYLIIFCTFFLIMIALNVPLFQFVPSTNCGPFSGTNYYYEFYKDIHLKWVSESLSFVVPRSNCADLTDCFDRLSLVDRKFWDSPATGPLTVVACGILLLYFATLKKKNDEIVQLRKQVLLLAVDRSFYIQGNKHFLSALSQKYLKDRKAQAALSPGTKPKLARQANT